MNTDRFKFRVFLKKENRYAKETEYDEYFWIGMDGRLYTDDGDDCPKHISYPGDNGHERSWGEIEDYVVEQCTGLKDQDGKLIYEGDIVASAKTNRYRHVISYNADMARFVATVMGYEEFTGGGIERDWISSKIVIGNINEKPELLEN